MNIEYKTMRAIIYSIVTAFCVVVLTIGGCVSHANDLIAKAINNGADPIKTVCALGTSSIDSHICTVAAASGRHQEDAK